MATSSASSSDTVDVRDGALWEIIVDDHVDTLTHRHETTTGKVTSYVARDEVTLRERLDKTSLRRRLVLANLSHLEIDASRHKIRADEDPNLTSPEALDYVITLVLYTTRNRQKKQYTPFSLQDTARYNTLRMV